jgi:hypothetical protein
VEGELGMESVLEIVRIVIPIIIIGGIAVFVIKRLQHKQKRGTLGKKESKHAQTLLNSLIPLGMIFGTAAGVIISLLFPVPLLHAFSFGPGIGLLLGYVAYEIYSKKKEGYIQ